jgi:hypothetical protein
MQKTSFTIEEVMNTAKDIKIDFNSVNFTPEILQEGMNVELEHGLIDPETNVTNDDPVKTAKIAWAHLKEDSRYYEYLEKMEKEMDEKSISKL